jgi:TFIIF-interacting CTD phosphatase-like protein
MDKPNIILDLDNTLICSVELSKIDLYTDERLNFFNYHIMEDYYIVFERPDLQNFLDWLFKNYNVSIWTAAGEEYALFVLENCILNNQERSINFFFFAYHCNESIITYGNTKDLRMLWTVFGLGFKFNQENTIIIDDLDHVYQTQPGNCVIASYFDVNDDQSYSDTFLMRLKYGLKHNLQIQEQPANPVNEFLHD